MGEAVSLRSRRSNEGKDRDSFSRRLKRGRLGKLSEELEAAIAPLATKTFSELTMEEKDKLLEVFAVSFGLVKG